MIIRLKVIAILLADMCCKDGTISLSTVITNSRRQT